MTRAPRTRAPKTTAAAGGLGESPKGDASPAISLGTLDNAGRPITRLGKMRYLTLAGWKVERKRGEPNHYVDPLGMNITWMRWEMAWALQVLREENNIVKKPRTS